MAIQGVPEPSRSSQAPPRSSFASGVAQSAGDRRCPPWLPRTRFGSGHSSHSLIPPTCPPHSPLLCGSPHLLFPHRGAPWSQPPCSAAAVASRPPLHLGQPEPLSPSHHHQSLPSSPRAALTPQTSSERPAPTTTTTTKPPLFLHRRARSTPPRRSLCLGMGAAQSPAPAGGCRSAGGGLSQPPRCR